MPCTVRLIGIPRTCLALQYTCNLVALTHLPYSIPLVDSMIPYDCCCRRLLVDPESPIAIKLCFFPRSESSQGLMVRTGGTPQKDHTLLVSRRSPMGLGRELAYH